MKPYFKSGDWNAVCDVCGFRFKASQLKKRWDGLMVCAEDFEHRHPQELRKPIKETFQLPFRRPETDVLIGPVCNIFTSQSKADWSAADCAQADRNDPINRGSA